MPRLIGSPTPLPAHGADAPRVDEFVGLINTGDTAVSIAHTRCPAGWEEPAKCPKFEEFIVLLKGMVRVEHADGVVEAALARQSTWGETSGSAARPLAREARSSFPSACPPSPVLKFALRTDRGTATYDPHRIRVAKPVRQLV